MNLLCILAKLTIFLNRPLLQSHDAAHSSFKRVAKYFSTVNSDKKQDVLSSSVIEYRDQCYVEPILKSRKKTQICNGQLSYFGLYLCHTLNHCFLSWWMDWRESQSWPPQSPAFVTSSNFWRHIPTGTRKPGCLFLTTFKQTYSVNSWPRNEWIFTYSSEHHYVVANSSLSQMCLRMYTKIN